ncbi:MAG: T9SS type A sorting domain-containing protein, partial [Chitinophagaceae bacterium]|nr:T9SS type A sorting domain-containing protein [Chitinophagaceae bacterium]
YTGAGTYSTCVRVYTACGMDMHCKEISTTCVATPLSSFSDTGKLVHGFTYTGTTAGLDSVKWNFGDGNYGTGTPTTHTYAVADTYTVCATVYTNCGTHTWCKDVVVMKPTVAVISVQSDVNNVQIFPNPVTSELHINDAIPNPTYNLRNITGSIIVQGLLSGAESSIQLSELPSGTYLLELTTPSGGRKVVRVVKAN